MRMLARENGLRQGEEEAMAESMLVSRPGEDEEGLDAVQVKALFAALRAVPGSMGSLREAYDRVKDRLTPSGRAAYQRELQRLLQKVAAVPEDLADLLDGDYGIVVRGDDGSESLGMVHCREGSVFLDLRLEDLSAFCEGFAVDVAGAVDADYLRLGSGEAARARLTGVLRLSGGFLCLEALATGTCRSDDGDRAFRRVLIGTGEARAAAA
jgi:hypothetical protein